MADAMGEGESPSRIDFGTLPSEEAVGCAAAAGTAGIQRRSPRRQATPSTQASECLARKGYACRRCRKIPVLEDGFVCCRISGGPAFGLSGFCRSTGFD